MAALVPAPAHGVLIADGLHNAWLLAVLFSVRQKRGTMAALFAVLEPALSQLLGHLLVRDHHEPVSGRNPNVTIGADVAINHEVVQRELIVDVKTGIKMMSRQECLLHKPGT